MVSFRLVHDAAGQRVVLSDSCAVSSWLLALQLGFGLREAVVVLAQEDGGLSPRRNILGRAPRSEWAVAFTITFQVGPFDEFAKARIAARILVSGTEGAYTG
jgi:hypothetical protein